MPNKKNTVILWIVFFVVFAINYIQSYYTELLPDEAYYWVYSQHLDWGYFDHPPMVALLIELSSYFFQGELGVRFMSNLVLITTAFIVWKTVTASKKSNLILFLMLFFSIPMINVYGFITTPDTGLILFVALFLYGYKEYLKQQSLRAYFILAIAAAGMLYSKYQGVWVIACVLVSNPKILRDGKLWLAGGFTIILLLPHILWQFENDFPSIRYHLYERVANRRYKFEHTLMHFVNMIVIVGLIFPMVYKAFFKNLKSSSAFNKALVYIVIGFFTLFFFSSFRGRVQAQWLVPICFSFLILTYDYYNRATVSKRWLYGLALTNIVLLFVARVGFASEEISPVQLDAHGNKHWATELNSSYPNNPKFFVNSYQNAATYWFYTQDKPFYYKNFTGRKNHFTLLQQKDSTLNFKEVLFANRGRTKRHEQAFKGTGKDSLYLQLIQNFKLPNQLQFEWKSQEEVIHLQNMNSLKGRIRNESNQIIDLTDFYLQVGFQNKKQRASLFINTDLQVTKTLLKPNESVELTIQFSVQFKDLSDFNAMGIGLKSHPEIEVFRISDLRMFTFTP